MSARIDPRLQRAIEQRELRVRVDPPAAGDQVQAVVTLRSGPDGKPLSPADTESSVARLVGGASAKVDGRARRVKVFKNLQSFAIEASPELLRALLEGDDDCIDSASLNEPD